jgi:hypothetical protein
MAPHQHSLQAYQHPFQLQLRCDLWNIQCLSTPGDGFVSVMTVVPMIQCVCTFFAVICYDGAPASELSVRFLEDGSITADSEDTWASEHVIHMVFEQLAWPLEALQS